VPVREPQALAERIETLLSDDILREQMGQAAAKLAQRYAWASIADRLMSVFEEVLARRIVV
jgi:glycosyltransferase involved in cell wall biosynthesis